MTNSHCVIMPTFAPSIYCKKPLLPSGNFAISLISQLLCKESNEMCILCYKLTYIKKRKENYTAIFADKAVLNHYRKIRTNYRNTKQVRSGSGKVFVF
jgi:intergrase/recombinase